MPMKMKNSFKFCALLGMAVLAAFGSMLPTQAADVSGYSIIKQQDFVQTAAALVVPDSTAPFKITLSAEPSDSTAIQSAMVRTAAGKDILLPEDNNDLFSDTRPTLIDLNTAYGPGAYIFTFDTENDGVKTAVLNVPADA